MTGGKFNGYGVMRWPNGSIYVGDWKDNLRHGEGIYVDKYGAEYVGGFVEGPYASVEQTFESLYSVAVL